MAGICEALVEQIDLGLTVWRREGERWVLESANPCAEALVGHSLAPGRSLRELVQAPLAEWIDRLASRGGVARERPLGLQRESGDRVYVALQVFPVDAGRIGVAIEDVTDEQRAHEDLERRSAQLAEAQALTHIGSWSWRPDVDSVEWSDEMYRIFGLAPGAIDVDLETYLERVHPEDRKRVRREIERALAGDRAFDHVQRVVRPDGEQRVLHSRGRVVEANGGRMMVGTCLDITEIDRREHALRRSETRYRRAFQYDVSGDFMTARDGRMIAVNDAFARMFGFGTAQEALDLRLVELFPSTEAYDAFFDRLTHRGRLADHHLELCRRDGTPVQVIGNFVADFDPDGTLSQLIGYLIDITRQRRLEAQLRQMQKLDAIGRLAGGMAHDFNNLLTIILSYSTLLRQGASDAQRPWIDALEDATRSGGELTRQLLTFARGQLAAARIVDVNRTIEGMRRMVQRLAGDDVAVELELTGDASVWADPGQIEQVVLNLAANARDAMADGGVFRIATAVVDVGDGDVAAYPGVPDGRYVVLRVSDTGTGIPPAVRERMFEPFFSTKPAGEGTGLGLSTVYGIVAQAGGRILVDSTLREGTTFTVLWPWRADRGRQAPNPPAVEVPARGTETILVVEDDDRIRALIEEILSDSGYDVIAAPNARRALELCRRDRIDVLLTDVVMPGMSGVELSKQVRDQHSGIRVIYMSGYSTHHAVQVGAVEADARFLAKPFGPDTLLGAVRAALDGRAAAR